MSPQENDPDSIVEEYIQFAHDHFFGQSMQNIEIGCGIAKLILSPSIKSCIGWDTMEIQKDGWIDKRLKEHRSDILYRANLLKKDYRVNLLFEHKSKADKKTHKQLLRYILESWDLEEQQVHLEGLLPVVLPIIIYHGNTPWKIVNSIKPMLAIIEEIEEFVPDFRAVLLDLNLFDPNQIFESRLKMFLLALKYSRTPDILGIVGQIIKISEKIYSGNNEDYLKTVLIYLGSVIKKGDKDRFWSIIAEEHREGEVYMETIAQALQREERMKRERIEKENAVLRQTIDQKNVQIKQKDIEIEQKETEIEQKETEIEQKETEIEQKDVQIILKMLEKKLSIRMIQEITGVSGEKIQQIKKGIDE